MTTRPVQASLMPDVRPDVPIGKILPSVFRGTNSDLMAAVADLYLQGTVCDVTYGKGGWWNRFRPADFVAHDLDSSKGDGVDFTALPEQDCTYDAVVFDPPYVASGGLSSSTRPEFRGAYGLQQNSSSDLMRLILAGMTEAFRVLRLDGFLLVKCMDSVASKELRMMHVELINAAGLMGHVCHDLIVHETGSGPGGHNIFTIKRARRHHSYLIVFRKGSK